MEIGVIGLNTGITVVNESRVKQFFVMAPKEFTRSMAKYMYHERNLFVGTRTKKKMGSFRRSLVKKQRKSYPGQWSKGMAMAFTGYVYNSDKLDNMNLNLGISEKWQDRIPYLEDLSKTHTVTPKNRKWLMIPFYKNLKSIGLFGRVGGFGRGKTKQHWGRVLKMLDEHSRTNWLFSRGRLLVFGYIEKKSGSHRARHMGRLDRKLLFVGVKSATIKKQYDFKRAFMRRKPGVIKRANKAVEKTVKNIDRKVSKGFYFVG